MVKIWSIYGMMKHNQNDGAMLPTQDGLRISEKCVIVKKRMVFGR